MDLQPFPDYDYYAEQADNYTGQPIILSYLSRQIAGVSVLGKTGKPIMEKLTAMILHHALLNNIHVDRKSPVYKGTLYKGNYGIIFKLDNFDPRLCLILHCYLSSIREK